MTLAAKRSGDEPDLEVAVLAVIVTALRGWGHPDAAFDAGQRA